MENLNVQTFFALNQFVGLSGLFDRLIIFFASYMAYILIVILVIGIIISNRPRSEKIKIAIASVLSGIIGRGILVEVIANFYQLPRPFLTFPDAHRLLLETSYSFPSRHATIFFGLSAVIYSYNKKIGIMFFVLSGIMGIARVMAGVHYPIDILCGALIGTVVGYMCTIAVENYSLPHASK
ncbi:MAG: phosphatase PAP2 family protein [Patescibacteria group bacterium]